MEKSGPAIPLLAVRNDRKPIDAALASENDSRPALPAFARFSRGQRREARAPGATAPGSKNASSAACATRHSLQEVGCRFGPTRWRSGARPNGSTAAPSHNCLHVGLFYYRHDLTILWLHLIGCIIEKKFGVMHYLKGLHIHHKRRNET
ncbi:hypothetical protein R5R35_005936 [Gryllus longicercus]|uniref:Uncharacterized protein n=1 Tax=Gryllus longicercus TaxID=2509291 RepID=A0AAN9YZN5_9ORTH